MVMLTYMQPDDDQDGGGSTSTATTTTASLVSRIAAINLDFGDKLQEYEETTESKDEGGEGAPGGNGGSALVSARLLRAAAAAAASGTVLNGGSAWLSAGLTEDTMQRLTAQHQGLAFQVCSRLFFRGPGNPPVPLKRLSMSQVEDFRQHGYVVIDNFINREAAARIKLEALRLYHRGKMAPAVCCGPPQQQQPLAPAAPAPAARSPYMLPLPLGRPPTDTSTFSPVMVALQELQEDLNEIMRLKHRLVEYQLSLHPPYSSQHPLKHKDALPDDGTTTSSSSSSSGPPGGPPQRRVTVLVFCNPDWERDYSGMLRLWPPLRLPLTASHHRRSHSGGGNSDGGTSFSESLSECNSLTGRSHFQGSVTSSVVAEVASTVDHDAASLDGVSMAESEAERNHGLEWTEVEGEMVLDVLPLAGRVVLMLSGAVDHALLPSSSDSVVVTAWSS